MKRLVIAAIIWLLPNLAYATQTSMICKTTETNEYIDIVSKSAKTNEVLVQINGGKFFDGSSMIINDLLIITVPLVEGGILIIYSRSELGTFMMSIDDQNQSHKISCKFRK